MPANLENSAVATGLDKVHFHSNPWERQSQRMLKLLHNCTHLTRQQSNAQSTPSQASKYMNDELSDDQAGFRRGRGTRDQTANIHWIIEKAREFQKNIYFCFIDYAKAFDSVVHNKVWKILQVKGIAVNLTCLLRNLYADFWTLWEKARVGCFERTASKHVYYLWWNRSPAQVGCMRQVLGPGALGRPRGTG